MSKDNLLKDIESDIDRDWIEIQKKLEEKKLQQYREYNRFPSIDNIIEMFSCIDDMTNYHDVYYVIRELKGFMEILYREPFRRNILNLMTSDGMNVYSMECISCHGKFNIICKDIMRIYDYSMEYIRNKSLKSERVYCPSCGSCLADIFNGDVVGILKDKPQDIQNMEERRNEFKYKF